MAAEKKEQFSAVDALLAEALAATQKEVSEQRATAEHQNELSVQGGGKPMVTLPGPDYIRAVAAGHVGAIAAKLTEAAISAVAAAAK